MLTRGSVAVLPAYDGLGFMSPHLKVDPSSRRNSARALLAWERTYNTF